MAAALLLGWLGYSTYLSDRMVAISLPRLHKQPGIVVVSYTKDGRTFHIQGFRDPLAADPKELVAQAGLDPENADLQLAPYYSLDDAMVAKRAEEIAASARNRDARGKERRTDCRRLRAAAIGSRSLKSARR